MLIVVNCAMNKGLYFDIGRHLTEYDDDDDDVDDEEAKEDSGEDTEDPTDISWSVSNQKYVHHKSIIMAVKFKMFRTIKFLYQNYYFVIFNLGP